MRKFITIWAVGLFTLVPAAIYYLLFKAESSQLPLILFVGFWIFGFWTFFVPLYKALRVRKLFKAIQSRDDLRKLVETSDTKDVAVSMIVKELGVPEFIAEKAYDALAPKITENAKLSI